LLVESNYCIMSLLMTVSRQNATETQNKTQSASQTRDPVVCESKTSPHLSQRNRFLRLSSNTSVAPMPPTI